MIEETKTTHMATETRAIPALTQRVLSDSKSVAEDFGTRLRARAPMVVTTIARGSSDHASAYLKYAIELLLGLPVASTGPSISSVYNAPMHLKDAASVAISQSGASPDIVAMATTAKLGGSLLLSLTNNSSSPLAALSDQNIDIGAGKELSVAATKTFVMSIVTGLLVLGHWKQDQELLASLAALPSEFENALDCDWSNLADHVAREENAGKSMYVLGRGPSFAIAQEIALKFKETCQIHAEAYSAAEVFHGPVSIAQKGFTVLALASNDLSRQSVIDASCRMSEQNVEVFVTAPNVKNTIGLPTIKASHPLTDPLVQIVVFYKFIEQLARKLDLNPDEPPHLRKITKTV